MEKKSSAPRLRTRALGPRRTPLPLAATGIEHRADARRGGVGRGTLPPKPGRGSTAGGDAPRRKGGRPRDAPHRSGSGERSRADSACGRRGQRGNVRSGGCQCRKWPQRRCHRRASNLRSAVRSDRGASLTSQAAPAHGAAVPGRRQVPVA